MSKEQTLWKDIERYSDYQVSKEGQIFSKLTCRILKPYPTPKGYLLVDLKGKALSVHRIVLMTFDPVEDMEFLQVNHDDLDKTNNALSNLGWMTNQENQIHSWENGREAAKGSAQGNSKLVESQVLEIIKLLVDNAATHKEIGRQYGVCKSTISKINTRKNWGHLWS